MKRAIVTAILTIVSSIALVTAPVAAADLFGDVCNGKAADSAVCKDKNTTTNPVTGSDGAILKIANIMAVIAGVASVIVIIVAGLKFIVSGGDSNQIASARRTIIYALIGLVVIVTGRLLVGLVVNAL